MRLGPPSTPIAIGLTLAATSGLAACGGGTGDGTETGAAFPTAAAPRTGTGPAPAARVEQGTPGATVATYLAAFSIGDGKAVCRLYVAAQLRRIEKAFGGTCADGIERAFLQGGAADGFKRSLGNVRVGRTETHGDRAVVQLVSVQGATTSDALRMRLRREGGTWRISQPGGAAGGR